MSNQPITEFEKAAASENPDNMLVEFWNFLRCNKKWWLLPLVVMLALFGMMMMLSGTAVAPFIYTLF
jgi:drug/metabolite transporter superfamily protein YnfA